MIFQNKIIIGLLISVFLTGFISYHKGYTNALNSDQVIADKAKIQQLQNNEILLQNTININNIILESLHVELYRKSESYLIVIESLKNDNSLLKKTLNRTNHINGLLVRTISAGINGVPTNATTTSRTYGITASYQPAEFAAGIISLGNTCNIIRDKYIALQNYNRDLVKAWNANK